MEPALAEDDGLSQQRFERHRLWYSTDRNCACPAAACLTDLHWCDLCRRRYQQHSRSISRPSYSKALSLWTGHYWLVVVICSDIATVRISIESTGSWCGCGGILPGRLQLQHRAVQLPPGAHPK